jgi:RHS repeat-associated protein
MKTLLRMSALRISCITLSLVLIGIIGMDRSFAQNQSDTPEVGRNIGVYTEAPVDMTVKVQGGELSVTRTWDGGKKRWLINAQHEPLTLSTEKQGEAFGYQLAKEISRGPRKSTQVAPGVWKRKSTEKSSIKNIPASVAQIALTNNFEYCKNKGEENFEVIYAAKDGYKWVSGAERSWAQYDSKGILQSWGKGNFLIAKLLYDAQGKLKGYADILDHQVITFERDPTGRITKVKDYEGREVNYTYNAAGLIETVTDMDGVKTRYDYENGNISLKTIGDDSNSAPGEEVNDKTTITYSYFSSKGELRSIETPESKVNYQYEYDKDNKLYTTTETIGNRVMRTTRTIDDVIASVEINGQYVSRTIRLCEDTATINKNNAVTYTDRNALGVVAAIVRPDGKKSTFQYIAANWPEVQSPWGFATKPWGLAMVVAPNGRITSYERDTKGQMEKMTTQAPSGEKRTWSFVYDSFSNKIEERLQAGNIPNNDLDYIQGWLYDSHGNIKSFQEGLGGPKWLYEYNSVGDVTKAVTPDGEIFSYTYTLAGRLKSSSNPVGHHLTYTYTERGLLHRKDELYALGQHAFTQYHYNHRGLVEKVTDPFQKDWSYKYTSTGELEETIDPLGKKRSYQYDAKGRLISTMDGNGVVILDEYFDTAPPGQAPQVEIPFPPRVLRHYPTYTEDRQYDFAGNLVIERKISKNGSTIEETLYEYDSLNQLVATIRPDGGRVERSWDLLGRPISIKAPDEGVTTISYTNGDRTITYVDALNGRTIYDLDETGRLKKQTGADGRGLTYTYNTNGSVSTITGGKDEYLKLFYDKARQLEKVLIFPANVAPLPVRTINYTRNLRGELTGIADGLLLQKYELDAAGRVLSAATTYDAGFIKSHSYTYSENGLTNSYTALDGTVYSYLWDPANQLQGVIIPGKGTVNIEYTSQNIDQPTRITFPGGNKQDFEYDDLRRLKRIYSSDQVGNILLDYRYDFVVGPLFGSAVKDIATEHGDYHYGYDKAFRLTSIVYPNLAEEGFSYDEIGRRQPLSGAGWSYNPVGAVTSTGSAQYTYDANGNRRTATENGVTTEYFYDESDKLVRIEKPLGTIIAEYGYDSLGRRLWKKVSNIKTYFYYTEDGLAAELDSAGVVTKKYLFAPGSDWMTGLLAIEENNNYHYSHNDHLKTPQKLVTASGAITWAAKYGAFGDANILTFTLQNPLRYPGQFFDPETSLQHNFHRNYDTIVGAYLEQDSYGVFNTGANRYFYARGNPLSFVDPLGLDVSVCKRRPDPVLLRYIGDHMWFKTDTQESGMGPEGGDVPGHGSTPDHPGIRVSTNDHTGESLLPESSCKLIENVNEECVDKMIMPGQSLGTFWLDNNCNTFVSEVRRKCAMGKIPMKPVRPGFTYGKVGQAY